MKSELSSPPSFWSTVRLLLAATRKRAAGRRRRQQELLQNRSGGNSFDWGGFGFALAILFMVVLNVFAAFVGALPFLLVNALKPKTEGRSLSARRSWMQ